MMVGTDYMIVDNNNTNNNNNKTETQNLTKEMRSSYRLLNIPCGVCGDKSTGKHYGIYSCDGCSGFFKRSIHKNRIYICKANGLLKGKCKIDRDCRNQCRACRLNKCFMAKMNEESVQHERGPRKSRTVTHNDICEKYNCNISSQSDNNQDNKDDKPLDLCLNSSVFNSNSSSSPEAIDKPNHLINNNIINNDNNNRKLYSNINCASTSHIKEIFRKVNTNLSILEKNSNLYELFHSVLKSNQIKNFKKYHLNTDRSHKNIRNSQISKINRWKCLSPKHKESKNFPFETRFQKEAIKMTEQIAKFNQFSSLTKKSYSPSTDGNDVNMNQTNLVSNLEIHQLESDIKPHLNGSGDYLNAISLLDRTEMGLRILINSLNWIANNLNIALFPIIPYLKLLWIRLFLIDFMEYYRTIWGQKVVDEELKVDENSFSNLTIIYNLYEKINQTLLRFRLNFKNLTMREQFIIIELITKWILKFQLNYQEIQFIKSNLFLLTDMNSNLSNSYKLQFNFSTNEGQDQWTNNQNKEIHGEKIKIFLTQICNLDLEILKFIIQNVFFLLITETSATTMEYVIHRLFYTIAYSRNGGTNFNNLRNTINE